MVVFQDVVFQTCSRPAFWLASISLFKKLESRFPGEFI